MNPRRFDACLVDVRGYLAGLREVEKAIVYGSVALGTAGPDSDLDLLILTSGDRQEELVRNLYRVGAQHDVTISPYLVTREDLARLDPQLLESVARDGVVVKGQPMDPSLADLRLEPYQLVTLRLDSLSQREKMRLSRELYGYESVRTYKRKRYRSRREGFVEKVRGRKLGKGTFLIPARSWPELETLLEKRRGKRWAFTVWVQTA